MHSDDQNWISPSERALDKAFLYIVLSLAGGLFAAYLGLVIVRLALTPRSSSEDAES